MPIRKILNSNSYAALLLAAAAAAFTVSACSPKPTEEIIVYLEEGVEVDNARIRAPLKGTSNTAAFFDITATGQDDALIGAQSPIAGRVEMHETLSDGGVMKMRALEQIVLPDGQTVSLKPGGMHLMLFDVKLEPGQEDAEIILQFVNSGPMPIIANITENAKSGHNH